MTGTEPILRTPIYSITGRCPECGHVWIIPTGAIAEMTQTDLKVLGKPDVLECTECDPDPISGREHCCPLDLKVTDEIYYQDKRIVRED